MDVSFRPFPPTEKRQYEKSLKIDFFSELDWAHRFKSRYGFDLPRSATRSTRIGLF